MRPSPVNLPPKAPSTDRPSTTLDQLSVPPPEAAAFVVVVVVLRRPRQRRQLLRRRLRSTFRHFGGAGQGAEELLHDVIVFEAEPAQEGVRHARHPHGEAAPHQHGAKGESKFKDGNDHVADQNLAADYFAEFPSEFPTKATMLGARQRRLPA